MYVKAFLAPIDKIEGAVDSFVGAYPNTKEFKDIVVKHVQTQMLDDDGAILMFVLLFYELVGLGYE
jgi:hypothetical protein